MYFIHDGNSQLGPLTFNQLKERKILKTTPVWKEGLPKWVAASHLEELNDLFISTPPGFRYSPAAGANKTVTEKIGFRLGRFFGMGGLIIVVCLLVVFIYDQWNSRAVYHAQYSAELFVDPEHYM